MFECLKTALEHPATIGMDLDDPFLTSMRRKIIDEKPFLQRIYEEWYNMISAELPDRTGLVLEVGSGAAPGKKYVPELITSDVSPYPWVSMAADAQHLPFVKRSLRGIVMNNVLHHLPDPQAFFREAERCVTDGGVIAMIEPWNTAWSRVVYKNLHHEPFDPGATSWCLNSSGPLSAANGALPWILFHRDADQFFSKNPGWRLEKRKVFMPFRYLVSGGVSLRNLAPLWSYQLWAGLESVLEPLNRYLGMFALLVLRKHEVDEGRTRD